MLCACGQKAEYLVPKSKEAEKSVLVIQLVLLGLHEKNE